MIDCIIVTDDNRNQYEVAKIGDSISISYNGDTFLFQKPVSRFSIVVSVQFGGSSRFGGNDTQSVSFDTDEFVDALQLYRDLTFLLNLDPVNRRAGYERIDTSGISYEAWLEDLHSKEEWRRWFLFRGGCYASDDSAYPFSGVLSWPFDSKGEPKPLDAVYMDVSEDLCYRYSGELV